MEIVTKREIFDIDRAHYILNNWDELINEISPNCHTSINDMRKRFEKYISNSQVIGCGIATREVNYRKTFNNQGRYFADKALSMQGIARGIRHSISDGLYVDVDIVNAHPCMLVQMMEAEKLDCTYLKDYVRNRQDRLKELQLSFNEQNPNETMNFEQAKRFILKLVNGGQDDENTKVKEKGINNFTKCLAKEMRTAHNHFAKSRKDEFEAYRKYKISTGKEYNFKASWMNFLLCDIENKALDGIRKFFDDDPSIILCFDGAMIPKKLHDSKVPKNEDGTYNYEPVQASIMSSANGFDLIVKDKPLEFVLNVFKDGTVIPKYEQRVYRHYNDYTEFSGENREFTLNQINEWADRCFATVDGDGWKKLVRYKRKFQRLGGSVQENTYVHIMNYKHGVDDIDSLCNILNPEFDLEFYEKYKDTSASNPNRKMPKFQRYKFTNLREYVVWRQSISKLGKKYDSVEYSPYLHNDTASPGALNLFAGYPHINKIPTPDFDFYTSLFYKLVLNDLCGGDVNECEHFLDTLADIIQDPLNIKRNAHVFVGPQGSGKGTLAMWLANVFGHNNVVSIENVARYFEKFNSATSCKLIKIFEENSEDGAIFKYADRLKAQITMPKEVVESKGLNAIEVDNCARCLFFSNHKSNVAKLEKNTRISYHESETTNANNKQYFIPIYKEMTPQFFVDCFHWLANKKYDKMAMHGCYHNAAEDRQKIAQMKTGYKFLVDFIENEFVDKDWKNIPASDRMFRFPISTLNTEFKSLNGGSRNDTFGKQLLELGIKAINAATHARGTNVTKCITLYPPHIEDALRKEVGVKSFAFDFSFLKESEESQPNETRDEIIEKIKLLKIALDREERKLADQLRKK